MEDTRSGGVGTNVLDQPRAVNQHSYTSRQKLKQDQPLAVNQRNDEKDFNRTPSRKTTGGVWANPTTTLQNAIPMLSRYPEWWGGGGFQLILSMIESVGEVVVPVKDGCVGSRLGNVCSLDFRRMVFR